MARNVYNGRCTVCGLLFVGMSKSEYNSAVCSHIYEEHRDADIDETVVEPL